MPSSYYVAFWNLENLFAPEGFPEREPWIERAVGRDLRGWSEAVFGRKIHQLASIVSRMHSGHGPDLLGVCEVENAFALQSLAGALAPLLPARDYRLVHVDAERDRRGIDTAFLYDANRLSVNEQEIFSHFVLRRTGTRDITQATFLTQSGRELIALANHWPSRSGGTETSRGFRTTAGETLGYWHERIREVKGDRVAVLAMGDFNDDPFDDSLTTHARATRERGDVRRGRSARLYNLSWRYLSSTVTDHQGNERELDGTLYYANNGNLFDQILVSKGLLLSDSPLQVDEASARIEAFPEMVSHRVGEGPIRFGLPRGDAANVNQDGFSDHFAVSVIVRES